MQYFCLNVQLEKTNPSNREIGKLVALLEDIDFNPAVGINERHYLNVRVTIPSAGLIDSVIKTVSTLERNTGYKATSVEVMTESEFESRFPDQWARNTSQLTN